MAQGSEPNMIMNSLTNKLYVVVKKEDYTQLIKQSTNVTKM